MSAAIEITRAGPLVTVQDAGRQGHFANGISASGPMDSTSFASAGQLLGTSATSGLEITTAGIAFKFSGTPTSAAFCGGAFTLSINGKKRAWNKAHNLHDKDTVEIKPGAAGNYGYIRFDADIDVPLVLGSRATNLIVGLGGYEGRAMQAGDKLGLLPLKSAAPGSGFEDTSETSAPIRFIWGIHADNFTPVLRATFADASFQISTKLDRMGVRLTDTADIFTNVRILSLVSDAIVPGDIQILGDGTPIVLMRDHQPTGGYPRIATVISADLDRFAQLRPGAEVRFTPVTIEHAHMALRQAGRSV